jgi:hypothetical protein
MLLGRGERECGRRQGAIGRGFIRGGEEHK